MTVTVAQVANHVVAAQGRLLQQHVDKPTPLALLAAVAGRTQVVENALFGLYTGRILATAIGAQLDGIGRVIGLPRSEIPSASDDGTYRIWLQAWIRVNSSSGTVADLIALYGAVAAPGTIVQVSNSGTASLLARLGGAAQTVGPTLVAVFALVRAAGVNASMDYLDTLPAFGFDGAGAGMDTGYLGGSV